MAIYHCSLKVFSRSKGHSAVAAAAYRSGCQLYDERIQKTHRYENRSGVAETFILLPENTSSEFQSRAVLWNAVEEAEKRKNSCVARELILALPHELSDKERSDLTRDMALYLMERYRVAVDSAIHAPTEGDGHDKRNHHAHLLFSTREITEDGIGKKTRILDDKVTGKEEIELIREVWETLANDALSRAGFSDVQIDRRSLEDQGIDRIPQTHVGNSAKHSENQPSSHEEEEGKDDEEEGEGDKSSSSGGAGGAVAPSLDLEPSELKELAVKEEALRKYDRGSRADFVEEIKALNAERAAFSEVPLKDQIAHIDRVMAKFDVRVSHLERLKERSSLSNRLKRSLEKLMEISVATVLNRKEVRLAQALNNEENQLRKERQQKHYGRTYRAGLHEQIREMKHNIETLKTKQQEYTRYKGFVEQIENQLDKHLPSEKLSQEPPSVKSKFITNEESSLKLALKANIAREQIPTEYKAKAGYKLTSLKVKSEKVQPNIRNDKSQISSKTHGIEIKSPTENNDLRGLSKLKISVKVGAEAKTVSTKARVVFNFNAELDPKTKSDLNPPYKQKIKNFDPIKTHQAEQDNKPAEQVKADRRSWFTPASDKSKPMMDDIAKKMAQQRREHPPKEEKRHDTSTMKGQFNARATEKFTTNEAHRAKTRAEAEVKRSQVPPEYRAKPYNSEQPAKPQEQDLKGRAQSTFKDAQDALKNKWENFRAREQKAPENEPVVEKPRAKMSDVFNKGSFESGDIKNDPNHSKDENPSL